MSLDSMASVGGRKEYGDGKAVARFWKQVTELAALTIWLGGFHLNAAVLVLCFFLLPGFWALTAIAVFLSQLFIPVFSDTEFANRVADFVCKTAPAHFPIEVHVEDLAAFDSQRAHLVAVEPHSLLPVGLIALTKQTGRLPWKKIKFAGSSALLWTPLVRHVWTWLGLVPANRKLFVKLLNDDCTVVLVPGGVQECLHLKPGQETIFLKKRYGFVQCAIESGSPLVPVFCFGQSEVYHYLKPNGKWYSRLSRTLRFTPLIFWGMYGTFFPYRQPISIVVGKPIEVTKNPTPSRDEVAALLGKFIGAMEELFEKHKAEAGYQDTKLKIL